MFFEISKYCDYEQFFTVLNYLTVSYNVNRYLPLFSRLQPSVFDLSAWLKTINEYLFNVLLHAYNAKSIFNDDTKRKEIYLQLTQTLLIFVYAETQNATALNGHLELKESRRFLKSCQNFEMFRIDEGHEIENSQKQPDEKIKQYKLCFGLLEEFLNALSAEGGAVKSTKVLKQFFDRMK